MKIFVTKPLFCAHAGEAICALHENKTNKARKRNDVRAHRRENKTAKREQRLKLGGLLYTPSNDFHMFFLASHSIFF